MDSLSNEKTESSDAQTSAFTDLADSLPFGLCAVDRDFHIRHANSLFHRLLKTGRETKEKRLQLVDLHISEVIPVEERDRWLAKGHAALGKSEESANGHALSFEMILAGEGEPLLLRIIATPVVADGSASGILYIVWDTASPVWTAQSGAQETARLEVARQLAATLNHEINNPLFIISATLEDLLSDASDAASQRRLIAALDAVWTVSSAVKQLSEIRQLITTAYITGHSMIDLEASQEPRR